MGKLRQREVDRLPEVTKLGSTGEGITLQRAWLKTLWITAIHGSPNQGHWPKWQTPPFLAHPPRSAPHLSFTGPLWLLCPDMILFSILWFSPTEQKITCDACFHKCIDLHPLLLVDKRGLRQALDGDNLISSKLGFSDNNPLGPFVGQVSPQWKLGAQEPDCLSPLKAQHPRNVSHLM